MTMPLGVVSEQEMRANEFDWSNDMWMAADVSDAAYHLRFSSFGAIRGTTFGKLRLYLDGVRPNPNCVSWMAFEAKIPVSAWDVLFANGASYEGYKINFANDVSTMTREDFDPSEFDETTIGPNYTVNVKIGGTEVTLGCTIVSFARTIRSINISSMRTLDRAYKGPVLRGRENRREEQPERKARSVVASTPNLTAADSTFVLNTITSVCEDIEEMLHDAKEELANERVKNELRAKMQQNPDLASESSLHLAKSRRRRRKITAELAALRNDDNGDDSSSSSSSSSWCNDSES